MELRLECPLQRFRQDRLQRVQIRDQIFDLLVGHDLAEAFHF